MLRTLPTGLLAAAFLSFGATLSYGSVVTPNLVINNPNSNATSVFELEGSGALDADLSVNVLGSVFGPGGPFTSGIIAAGTQVSSYFFEINGNGSPNENYTLDIVFDSEILGVVFNTGLLSSSFATLDGDLEFTNVQSAQGSLNNRERNSLSGNVTTLAITNGRVTSGADSFRVLVAVPPAPPEIVPEPASVLCWAGLVGLAAVRRRNV